MKKKSTTIKSWSNKYVRVKTKYIDECIENGKEVCYVRYVQYVSEYAQTQACITDPKNSIFFVEADIYGIDLEKIYNRDYPTHQLIIKQILGGEIIFKQVLWDAEMFEEVVPVTTTTTEWVLEAETTTEWDPFGMGS